MYHIFGHLISTVFGLLSEDERDKPVKKETCEHIMDDITLSDTAEVDCITLVTCLLYSGIRIL